MKLYTEEQVNYAIYLALNEFSLKKSTHQKIFDSLTPIELPSDEQMGKEDIINLWNWLNDGYVIRRSLPTIEELIGWFEAKWMRDKFTNTKEK